MTAAQISTNGSQPISQYPSYTPNPVKKKSKIVPYFIIAFIVTIGVFGILILSGIFSDDEDKEVVNNPPVVSNPKSTGYKYSYSELPDVVSLDSDERFTYSDVYNEEGVTVYSYLFYEENATDSGFYEACESYSQLLQTENNFIYEKEYTEQQYEETGEPANYLTRDNYVLSITASIEDSSYYAYVTIIPLVEEEQNNEPQQQQASEIPNYNNFLAGRETISFTYDDEVSMDNGLTFAVHDVIGNYPGDNGEIMTVGITLDIISVYSDYYLNNGDFMILPLDKDGNILADAQPISYALNNAEESVTMPFLVSNSSNEKYTFKYAAPIDTAAFSIYATNFLTDQSTPTYVMEIGIE